MEKILVAVIASAIAVAMLSVFGTLAAFASSANCTPSGQCTGQPGAPTTTCGSSGATATPGNSANAGGSPFNSEGTAGAHYAGNQGTASLANSNSPGTSVSQYDTACAQVSNGH